MNIRPYFGARLVQFVDQGTNYIAPRNEQQLGTAELQKQGYGCVRHSVDSAVWLILNPTENTQLTAHNSKSETQKAIAAFKKKALKKPTIRVYYQDNPFKLTTELSQEKI